VLLHESRDDKEATLHHTSAIPSALGSTRDQHEAARDLRKITEQPFNLEKGRGFSPQDEVVSERRSLVTFTPVIGELLNLAQFLPRLKDVAKIIRFIPLLWVNRRKIGTMPNPITSRQSTHGCGASLFGHSPQASFQAAAGV
jgi:hypothetical protein